MKDKITLWLDTKDEPYVLEIHDHGHVEVDRESKAQKIVWQLTGPLAKGAFVPLTDTAPGFEWVLPGPLPGIFAPAIIDPKNPDLLILMDDHTSHTSDGEWEYILRVVYEGKIYTTMHTLGRPTTPKSPIIINR